MATRSLHGNPLCPTAAEDPIQTLNDRPIVVTPSLKVAVLLSAIGLYLGQNQQRKAINLVISRIDDWCLAGEFDTVNRMLVVFDPAVYEPVITLALLTAVHPARDKLHDRAGFLARVDAAWVHKLGAERAAKLLTGYR